MNKDLLHSKVELFETGGEISYQGDANVAKFLLGGIGTGNISVGARGQLLDWEIFNWPERTVCTIFFLCNSYKGRGRRTCKQNS